MEPESRSCQQSPLSTTSAPLGGVLASGESAGESAGEDALEEGAEDGAPMPAALSRLSFCVAWLFGLEAFLTQADARVRTPRA